MPSPRVVVTNDDGIDSAGLRRLHGALSDVADVTVVAPEADQSAVGRSIQPSAEITAHELGYAVAGAPATCVVTAVSALDLDPDLVVSGINTGANLGTPALGRSGTVGAAIEAAYMGYPAIAASAYVPFERIQGDFHEFVPDPEDFTIAARAVGFLLERLPLLEGVDGVDYFNLNAPLDPDVVDPAIRVTRPAPGYHTVAERDGSQVHLRDRQFELLHTGDLVDERDTDRGALAAGEISLSPLVVPSQRSTVASVDGVRELLAGSEDPAQPVSLG